MELDPEQPAVELTLEEFNLRARQLRAEHTITFADVNSMNESPVVTGNSPGWCAPSP